MYPFQSICILIGTIKLTGIIRLNTFFMSSILKLAFDIVLSGARINGLHILIISRTFGFFFYFYEHAKYVLGYHFQTFLK